MSHDVPELGASRETAMIYRVRLKLVSPNRKEIEYRVLSFLYPEKAVVLAVNEYAIHDRQPEEHIYDARVIEEVPAPRGADGMVVLDDLIYDSAEM